MTETIGVQQSECQKQSLGGRGEFGVVSKLQKYPTKEQKCYHCPERRVFFFFFFFTVITLFGSYMAGAT